MMLGTLDLEGGNYVADDVLEGDAVGATSLSAQYESEAQGEITTVGHAVCERERSQQTFTEPSAEVDGTEVGATISDVMTSKTATVEQLETCEHCCNEKNSGLVEHTKSDWSM
ncbi:hypothetical protein GN958_ATG17412 [Phytophthora infestans]|uniref:Uncharacterized protein n=1 Tax=Phytophthora infestans TaxID=4787 RepID=A0A8S9TZC2_PHYIN|nr:hypothetical protein GN958_ATG17412 [Phytophthora infestans]